MHKKVLCTGEKERHVHSPEWILLKENEASFFIKLTILIEPSSNAIPKTSFDKVDNLIILIFKLNWIFILIWLYRGELYVIKSPFFVPIINLLESLLNKIETT